MDAFMSYFREYWYLFVILVILLGVMLFMFRKAGLALQKTKEEKEKLIKKLDHMKLIRETYSDLDKEKILEDDGENLLEGVADNIQVRLEKAEDMNNAFEELNEEEKLVYAFHYFLDEAAEVPSAFFKQFTKPLTPYTNEACKKFLSKETAVLVTKMYDAYDEDNETASVIASEISSLDDEIAEKLDVVSAKAKACQFIKDNVEKFV